MIDLPPGSDIDGLTAKEQRIAALLIEAACYEPALPPPSGMAATFVRRRRRQHGIPLRFAAACGLLALCAFAWRALARHPEPRHREALGVLPAVEPPAAITRDKTDQRSGAVNRAPLRMVSAAGAGARQSPRAAKTIARESRERKRQRAGRRAKHPLWTEEVVREYRAGIIAPALLMQREGDLPGWRAQPGYVDLPLVRRIEVTAPNGRSPDPESADYESAAQQVRKASRSLWDSPAQPPLDETRENPEP